MISQVQRSPAAGSRILGTVQQPDQGALHDGEITGVVGPGAAVFQARVQPVPGLGVSTTVTAGVGDRRHRRWRPVLGAGQGERGTVTRWAPTTPTGGGRGCELVKMSV